MIMRNMLVKKIKQNATVKNNLNLFIKFYSNYFELLDHLSLLNEEIVY